ncbi:MAG: DNRLRE domain-containing protein [Planctomycetota bacterium]|nr:MAG: DNRLRE domain-containing protein [Planctomycetota bacterium]
MRPFTGLLLAAAFCPAVAAQTLVTLNPTQDSFVRDINPDSSFGTQDLWFGRGEFWGLGNIRTLVQFNLSGLPTDPLLVRSARFSAYQYATEQAAGGIDCELHAVTAPWTEAIVTWNNQPGYDPRAWSRAEAGDIFHTGWVSWDATAIVREQASGVFPNHGWLFRVQDESAGISRLGYFYSNNTAPNVNRLPRLDVETYEMRLDVTPLAGGQPATLSVTGADPGRRVFFARSLTGTGATFVPQLGVTLELGQPALIGSAFADAAGAASLVVNVPAAGSGRHAWIQAAALGELSNLNSQPIL